MASKVRRWSAHRRPRTGSAGISGSIRSHIGSVITSEGIRIAAHVMAKTPARLWRMSAAGFRTATLTHHPYGPDAGRVTPAPWDDDLARALTDAAPPHHAGLRSRTRRFRRTGRLRADRLGDCRRTGPLATGPFRHDFCDVGQVLRVRVSRPENRQINGALR
ncbi:DUF2399 domain-containing protein [Streptomyces sp. NPDC007325]|uniref:DUF2399 domain-containing protein n=1 Tax=Streptomyces sp. NPDC007325 TaxID=3154588 RepID=UPI0033E62CA4